MTDKLTAATTQMGQVHSAVTELLDALESVVPAIIRAEQELGTLDISLTSLHRTAERGMQGHINVQHDRHRAVGMVLTELRRHVIVVLNAASSLTQAHEEFAKASDPTAQPDPWKLGRHANVAQIANAFNLHPDELIERVKQWEAARSPKVTPTPTGADATV